MDNSEQIIQHDKSKQNSGLIMQNRTFSTAKSEQIIQGSHFGADDSNVSLKLFEIS